MKGGDDETPFSDDAGAFSAPEPGAENPLPDWLGLDDYARLVTQVSARRYPEVPTGNGFCMYMRRDCIDRVGALNADVRAARRGERFLHAGEGAPPDACRRRRHLHLSRARRELLARRRPISCGGAVRFSTNVIPNIRRWCSASTATCGYGRRAPGFPQRSRRARKRRSPSSRASCKFGMPAIAARRIPNWSAYVVPDSKARAS